MSRAAVFFLVFGTLGLSILLAWLGWITLQSNFMGWFLLISGSVYFIGIIVVFWIRGIRFWRSRSGGVVRREEAGDRSFWLVVIGMTSAFYLPPFEYLISDPILPRHIWMQIGGLLLTVLGSILFIWARRALGKFYAGHVSVVEGQQLVQHGPYHFIRHPAYAGYLLITLGLALGYSSLLGLLAIVFLLVPAVVYRIRVEDRLLGEQFGSSFDVYAVRTKRLLPYLW